MTFLPGVFQERQVFVKSSDAPNDVGPYVSQVIEGWQLDHLVVAACAVARELVAWTVANGPSGEFTIAVIWDEPVVHIEVSDHGALVPDPCVSLADATFAVRVLAPPAIEWGAELDSRGRCLWAAFTTSRSDPAPFDTEALAVET